MAVLIFGVKKTLCVWKLSCLAWGGGPLPPIPAGLIKGISPLPTHTALLSDPNCSGGAFTRGGSKCWPQKLLHSLWSGVGPSVYQAGVVYGSKRHLVAISYTAKELFCAWNIACVQRAKNCLSIMTSYIGPNSRGCQNTVPLVQPPAILSGCLQSMKKLEI